MRCATAGYRRDHHMMTYRDFYLRACAIAGPDASVKVAVETWRHRHEDRTHVETTWDIYVVIREEGAPTSALRYEGKRPEEALAAMAADYVAREWDVPAIDEVPASTDGVPA